MMCLLLMGCSNSSLESNDTADRIQREGQTMTATRKLGYYELRLCVQQSGDLDFTFQPGIRYRGQDANHEIFHSKQLFDING